MLHVNGAVMDFTFQLNNQVQFVAAEIHNISSCRMLSEEFQTLEFSLADMTPEYLLRRGLLCAMLTG